MSSLGVPVVAGTLATATSLENLQGPSLAHPFGTDALGRDIAIRAVVAGRDSIMISLGAVCIGLVVGIAFAVVSAIRGRVVAGTVLRTMDVILAFPALILALVFALMIGRGRLTVTLVIAIVLVPLVVRLVRPRLVSELQKEYVLAERATGASTARILGYHVARNIVAPLAVFGVLAVADAMLFEATLSFIGVGIQPPAPSWGNMLVDGQAVLTAGAWWVSVFPGAMLFVTILCLNIIVDRRLSRTTGEMHRFVT